ncbi:MAG: HAMP domain-containing protein, partial [Prevotella sp.]|nr:HAMP domain-containing protein [Prevotella sp.]
TEQKWYTEPMKLGKECWVDLMQQGEYEGEALTTFCLPIYDKNNQCVGVIGTDLNIEHKKEIAYSDAEVFHSFRYLTYLVLAVTVVGILLFVILCRMVIRREMRPLRMLTKSAQRVADGNFSETVPDTQRDDEIGQLQELFKLMQQSLASKSAELEQLTTRLTTRSEELRRTLGHAQGSDRMKTSFLHYMTTQMTEPSDLIERSVMKLCNNYYTLTPQEADYEVEVIKTQSETILDLLDHMVEALNIEAEEAEKEVREIKEGKEVSDGQD